MTHDEIIKSINHVLQNTFSNIDDLNLKELKLLSQNGILDSVNILNFINNIEEHFNIKISDEDLNLDYFTDVERLSELIKTLI